ncbi:glycosyltransferase [Pseudoalteromonas tunicata]|uniref:glycosyltransferase n=1 Tax=Pseudoalteromonas tunicata TaxID=314281 RepID=UPI00273F88EE|nr:glycosyltransferase [Pseudoalteromonas tunicata]MDP5211622.1 glycosyltransferase [Pseudoalteromonas tunicata]
MKKNIIHVVESTATGTLSMIKVLANEQSKQGHKVTIVYSKRPETPSNISDLFLTEIQLINLQMSGIKNKLLTIFRLRKIVESNSTGCVFLHSSFAGFIGRIALLGIDVRCFYIPHCISFMRKDINKIQKQVFIFLEWLGSIKKCDYIACSESEKVEIQKYIPFRETHLVENAVDTVLWSNQLPWLERKNQVITVGQIRLQKNPEHFAEICRLSKSLNLGFDFLWVGDGDDLKAKDLLKNAGVNVLGWKKPDEVRKLLSESKIYLSTALWEGLPVSPIEAMLSGCVALLSDCAGNRDIILNEENGFSFTNSEQAVAVLNRIQNDETLGLNISSAGEQHAKNHFNLERYIVEMNRLIDKDK